MAGAFDSGDGPKFDPEVARMIEVESQKARFTQNAYQFTDVCWDKCMDKIPNRMDSRTEACLSNCVERFLDTTHFVLNRLGSMGKQD